MNLGYFVSDQKFMSLSKSDLIEIDEMYFLQFRIKQKGSYVPAF